MGGPSRTEPSPRAMPTTYANASRSASGHGARSRPTLRAARIERAAPMARPPIHRAVGRGVWEPVEAVALHRRPRRRRPPVRPLGVSQRRPVTADVLGMAQRITGTTPLLIDVAEIPTRMAIDRLTATPARHPAGAHQAIPTLARRLVDRPGRMLPVLVAIATHRRLVRLSSNREGYLRERVTWGALLKNRGGHAAFGGPGRSYPCVPGLSTAWVGGWAAPASLRVRHPAPRLGCIALLDKLLDPLLVFALVVHLSPFRLGETTRRDRAWSGTRSLCAIP